jgi:hypothetical protein
MVKNMALGAPRFGFGIQPDNVNKMYVDVHEKMTAHSDPYFTEWHKHDNV